MTIKINPKTRKPGTPRANKGKAIRDITKGRICTICKIYKDRDEFYEHPSGFNGLGSRCKECYGLLKEIGAKNKKKAYSKRKKLKQCIKCGSSKLITNLFCFDCWFYDASARTTKTSKNAEALKIKLAEQNNMCFYSGEILIPGKNASIDHQTPSSRDGSNKLYNLKWVSEKINLMKSNMTHEEFIRMCKFIADRFDDNGIPKK